MGGTPARQADAERVGGGVNCLICERELPDQEPKPVDHPGPPRKHPPTCPNCVAAVYRYKAKSQEELNALAWSVVVKSRRVMVARDGFNALADYLKPT